MAGRLQPYRWRSCDERVQCRQHVDRAIGASIGKDRTGLEMGTGLGRFFGDSDFLPIDPNKTTIQAQLRKTTTFPMI
jgi:hypothetical protein